MWARDGETYLARDLKIGQVSRDYTGYRNDTASLYIDVTLRQLPRTRETTEHYQVTNAVEISVCGSVAWREASKPSCCGQIREALDHVVKYADGWDAAKVARLREIWDRWHLNGMRAGCVHQEPQAGLDSPKCPETGYAWGHGWLTELAPVSVINELREMFK